MVVLSMILTVLLRLSLTMKPISRDLAILVPMTMTTVTTMTTDGQTDCFTPCTCARGNNYTRAVWDIILSEIEPNQIK